MTCLQKLMAGATKEYRRLGASILFTVAVLSAWVVSWAV